MPKNIFFVFFLLILITKPAWSDEIDYDHTVTPSLGIGGLFFYTNPTDNSISFVKFSSVYIGATMQYQFSDNWWIGYYLGVSLAFGANSLFPIPDCGIIYSYSFDPDFSIGMEIGFIPGIFFSIYKNVITLKVLPLYPQDKIGFTIATLTWGYEFKY